MSIWDFHLKLIPKVRLYCKNQMIFADQKEYRKSFSFLLPILLTPQCVWLQNGRTKIEGSNPGLFHQR